MSCKLSINNSIKLNNDPNQQYVKGSSIDSSIKLAGEEAKDRLYEPKHKKKLVRVLTVVAYVFFVSLAAIMLSLYYVFLWNGNQKDVSQSNLDNLDMDHSVMCDNGNVLVDIAFEPTAIPVMEATVTTRTEDLTEELVEEDTYVEQNSTKIEALKIRKRSPIMLEKLFNKHMLN